MLTEVEVNEALARLTYKPGWAFTYYLGEHEGPHIRVYAAVENSYSPGELVELDIHLSIPLRTMETAGDLYDYLLWRVERAEIHETMEWFKVDGKPWVDPHRPGADRDLPEDKESDTATEQEIIRLLETPIFRGS
jgi:hypothetical protein